jgi:hypothetical protein
MTDTQRNETPQAAAERAEREEMFGFHPEILSEAGELPRKLDGRGYEDPAPDQTR